MSFMATSGHKKRIKEITWKHCFFLGYNSKITYGGAMLVEIMRKQNKRNNTRAHTHNTHINTHTHTHTHTQPR